MTTYQTVVLFGAGAIALILCVWVVIHQSRESALLSIKRRQRIFSYDAAVLFVVACSFGWIAFEEGIFTTVEGKKVLLFDGGTALCAALVFVAELLRRIMPRAEDRLLIELAEEVEKIRANQRLQGTPVKRPVLFDRAGGPASLTRSVRQEMRILAAIAFLLGLTSCATLHVGEKDIVGGYAEEGLPRFVWCSLAVKADGQYEMRWEPVLSDPENRNTWVNIVSGVWKLNERILTLTPECESLARPEMIRDPLVPLRFRVERVSNHLRLVDLTPGSEWRLKR
ncbi:MAG: hypothetical protein IPL39_01070 [Opitutaceae bacterium]|nr:hypothetical protein [Opitutaceae bacterium]